jgi:hypothetical protein
LDALCVVLIASPPAATRHHTYSPVLLIADPPDGSVHPDGVVDVTEPSTMHTSRFPAVGVNGVPSTTVPVLAGLIACVVEPLRAAAMTTRLIQDVMSPCPP